MIKENGITVRTIEMPVNPKKENPFSELYKEEEIKNESNNSSRENMSSEDTWYLSLYLR